jgi:hypothetical protein
MTAPVPRNPQLVVIPDAQPAGTAGGTHIIEVEAFAVKAMLVTAFELAIHIGPTDILAPGIDSGARGWFRGFECLAVDTMRSSIVLPENVVVPVWRKHRNGACLLLFGIRARQRFFDGRHLCMHNRNQRHTRDQQHSSFEHSHFPLFRFQF